MKSKLLNAKSNRPTSVPCVPYGKDCPYCEKREYRPDQVNLAHLCNRHLSVEYSFSLARFWWFREFLAESDDHVFSLYEDQYWALVAHLEKLEELRASAFLTGVQR